MAAFNAMLAQQWVGRYNQVLLRSPSRVRFFLFRGAQKYNLSNAVAMVPILLNISVLLFLLGLILFLFTVSHVLATMITVWIGLFGLAYLTLTILPTIHSFCPYFTPMSGAWWYLWHISLSSAAFPIQWILGRFRADSLPYHLNEGDSLEQGTLTKLSRVFDYAFQKHTQCVKDGLRRSIIHQVLNASLATDRQALTWLLQRPAMADKSKIQEVVDSIPASTLLQLSCDRVPVDSGQVTIHVHLSNLLQSCTQGTTELQEDARSRRLLICLDAFHHIIESYPILNGESPSDVSLKHVWPNFKDVELVRRLWTDNDPAVRVTSRSICTHLAGLLLRKHPLERSEQTWLQEIMGDPESQTYPPDRVAIADHRNLMSFVYGVLSNCAYDFNVKSITRFAESLAVLMNAGRSAALNRDIFEAELTLLIEQVENGDHHNRDEVVDRLRKMFHVFLHVDPHQITELNRG